MAHYNYETLTPQGEGTLFQDLCSKGVQQHRQINAEPHMQQPQICIAPTTEQQIYTEHVNQLTRMHRAPTFTQNDSNLYTKPVTPKFGTSNSSTLQQQIQARPAFLQHQMSRGRTAPNEMHHAHQILQHTEIYKDIPQHNRCPEIPQEVQQPTFQSHENGLQNKTCKSKIDLSSNNAEHALQNYHKCDVCGKNYPEKILLQKHYLIHSGDNPNVCGFCEKKFRSNSHLQAHILTHTGEKPFSCNYCQNKFSQKSNLKTHLLTHTGEKPYTCGQCYKGFAQKATLNTHLLAHTGTQKFHSNRPS